jgi:hypothetical protein
VGGTPRAGHFVEQAGDKVCFLLSGLHVFEIVAYT